RRGASFAQTTRLQGSGTRGGNRFSIQSSKTQRSLAETIDDDQITDSNRHRRGVLSGAFLITQCPGSSVFSGPGAARAGSERPAKSGVWKQSSRPGRENQECSCECERADHCASADL